MENQQKIYTEKEVIGFVINQLSGIGIPMNVLALCDPGQIMNIKQQVIDPVEGARRTLIELLKAYEQAEHAEQEDGIRIEEVKPEDIPEDAEIIELEPEEETEPDEE